MPQEYRLLVVDDNPAIHDDFREILSVATPRPVPLPPGIKPDQEDSQAIPEVSYRLDHAMQGNEAVAMVKLAIERNDPYSLVFMDVRMPPGMDGIETIAELWDMDSEIEMVLCTAYSDYSWEQIVNKLGRSDKLVVLKKPFDTVEVKQLALSLTNKWALRIRNKHMLGELKQESEQLEIARQKAEESSQLKSDFIAIISHELKTPLTAILGYINLLLTSTASNLDDVQQEHCQRIDINARKLHNLIKDILFISEIESGVVECRPEAFCPEEITKSVIEGVKPIMDDKDIEFIYDFDTGAKQIYTDRFKFETIISNLVTNAVKFTMKGSVIIRGKIEDESFLCEVEDTGIGIAEEHYELIFEKFRQVDESLTRHYRGTGLGLTIAKRMSNMLKGDITVQSKVGKGTTFTVNIQKQLSTD